jgi:outer membrane protein assembly factor BamC
MKRKVLVAALVVPALLAGCGSLLESKKVEYKSAGKLPPLEVPPDLTQPTRDDRFSVPDVTPKGSATFSAYADERASQGGRVATGPEVLPQVDKMRIERAGTQRWLVVTGSPDKVWSGLKDFWQNMGFIVTVEMPEAGIMETDWAENRAKIPQGILRDSIGKAFDFLYSTPERDKFRTRIEKGAQPDTTEIYISHRGMYEIYTNEGKSETRWQPRPADPELEAEMLRRLMVRLGADESKAKTLVAEAVQDERAKLLPEGGLQVLEPFDRGWRRVGLALDRVGFTVEDRDRAQGVYFVRYVDPEIDVKKKGEDEGFMSKLAFWRGSKTDPSKSPRYRIHVKAVGDTSVVQVLTAEGGAADQSETGKKILRLLHEQLK